MRKDDLNRVRHMLDAAREAILFARNKSRIDLDENRMLALSISRLLRYRPRSGVGYRY